MHAITLSRLGVPLVVLSLLLLAGCATPPPPRSEYAEIGFTHLNPLRLDVATITVEQAYSPPLEHPHVEHLFPDPPGNVAERWVRQRLVPVGTEGSLRFVVLEASVVETELERTGGLRGLFTVDQSERYDARLLVEIELLNEAGHREASVKADVSRSRSVPENASLTERERLWHEMTEALMSNFDRETERIVREGFFAHLVM